MLRMDFQDADDPKTLALLNQIMEDENWASWGLWKLKDAFSRLVEAVLRIAGALALSASLFTLPVPQGSPLAALNSPWCLPAMLALMAGAVGLSALCYSRAQTFWSAIDGSFSWVFWYKLIRSFPYARYFFPFPRYSFIDLSVAGISIPFSSTTL